ncbi:hypothetical protein GmarT_33830 [Gimesia maris]|uniref:DUF3179 domain-containing protein n=2 Tax=Gimesia maris TaxID=122 RepID=A0ABX5YPN1_9PLAN|nr:hypothetical protein GmarT_33830 [Gimesia maris]
MIVCRASRYAVDLHKKAPVMDSSHLSEEVTVQDPSNTSFPAAPASDKPSQPALLLIAVSGLLFAGWYAWVNQVYFLSFWHNRPVAALTNKPEFNVQGLMLPNHEIVNARIPKDGIPALTTPDFIQNKDATFMKPHDRVAGVCLEGEARAYPLKILDWHEVVNDQIGETPFIVTYCPLSDSLAVYNGQGTGGKIEFGISGYLFNSNQLLYDRTGSGETDGLWSQMMSQAICGPRVQETLMHLPVELTDWQDWKQRYPDTKVLSPETGFPFEYQSTAYKEYLSNDSLMFEVNRQDLRLPKKTPLLGIWVGDQKRAYPVTAYQHLTEATEWEEELEGKKFTLAYHPEAKSLRVVKAESGLNWMYALWFAWYAFYPDTELYPALESAVTTEAVKPDIKILAD